MNLKVCVPSSRLSWVTLRGVTYIIDESSKTVITLEDVGVELWQEIILRIPQVEIVKKICSSHRGLIEENEVESAISMLLGLDLIEVIEDD